MKTRSISICSLVLIAATAVAQVPQKFNYQVVVRDQQHGILSNRDVGFKMSILKGSPDGGTVYAETHVVSTNPAGMADLMIGNGQPVTGVFEDIPWASDLFFLKVEADPEGGEAYQHLGTSQLISVPYALYTANVSSPTRKFTIQEEMGHPADSALFEVRNAEGQVLFAVYPEGTRVYILDEQAKGVKAGFAVGGYRRSTKGITNEYMRVTPDSIRMYFRDEPSKGVKGGFAVGGYRPKSKGPATHFFTVKPDSAKFQLISDQPADALPNALTVTTRSTYGGEGVDENLFNLTRDNYFIGHRAGASMTTGRQNSFIGYESGASTTEGFGNIFVGHRSGTVNTLGHFNTFIGYETGIQNDTGANNVFLGYSAGVNNNQGSDNVYIGSHAGWNTEGFENVFIGSGSGSQCASGNTNVFIGKAAGDVLASGSDNVCIGGWAGGDVQEGFRNVFIGRGSGSRLLVGSDNVYLGTNAGNGCTGGNANTYLGAGAGSNNTTGSDNIFIGRDAGKDEQGSGKLYIDNQNRNSENALVYGDLYGNSLRINNKLGIGREAITMALEVEGDAYKTSGSTSWEVTSDARVKTGIRSIEGALEKIMSLRPVSFRYTDEWREANPGVRDKVYYHYIAQEFAEVFPESVQKGPEKLEEEEDGLLRLDSQPAQVVAVRAIQELIEQNRRQQDQIEQLQKEIAGLKASSR